jgi:hypothetical protein
MSAETSPAQGFPTPCTRCGGVLYQHVDFCPYCGADHPLERTPRKRAGAQLRAVETTPPASGELAVAGASVPPLASSDLPVPPLDAPQPLWQSAGRWIFTKGVVLLLFIAALGYAGYLLLGDNHKQETNSDEPMNSASTSGGSISPYTPPAAHNVPTSNVTNVTPAKTPPAPIAAPRPPVARHYRDVPDALRAAHASLAQSNLAEAKSALSDALSVDPNNTDAVQMQSDLKDRENKRDIALGAANTCAKDKLWGCVRERASQALAIDVSSADAQALLERVILSTGWKPLTGNASTNAPANATANASASIAPAIAPPPTGMAASAPATPHAASAVSALDAQMRAIRESGWKQAPSGSTANKP